MKGGSPVGGSGGILPLKILKFQVLRNAISAILRQSQRVLISFFLKLKCHIFHKNITKLRKNMQICINKTMIKI